MVYTGRGFPKNPGYLFRDPYNKDDSALGCILSFPKNMETAILRLMELNHLRFLHDYGS